MFLINAFLIGDFFRLWFPTIAFMVDPGVPGGPGGGDNPEEAGTPLDSSYVNKTRKQALIFALVIVGLIVLIPLLLIGACFYAVFSSGGWG